MMSHMPAAIPNSIGGVAAIDQDETVVSPSAGPKLIRIKDIPTAPRAPAQMAGHSTPASELSTEASATRVASFAIVASKPPDEEPAGKGQVPQAQSVSANFFRKALEFRKGLPDCAVDTKQAPGMGDAELPDIREVLA
jgi:hypothetical protein